MKSHARNPSSSLLRVILPQVESIVLPRRSVQGQEKFPCKIWSIQDFAEPVGCNHRRDRFRHGGVGVQGVLFSGSKVRSSLVNSKKVSLLAIREGVTRVLFPARKTRLQAYRVQAIVDQCCAQRLRTFDHVHDSAPVEADDATGYSLQFFFSFETTPVFLSIQKYSTSSRMGLILWAGFIFSRTVARFLRRIVAASQKLAPRPAAHIPTTIRCFRPGRGVP